MSMEDIGGIKGEAQLDISQVETALKSYTQLLDAVNKQMGLTEQGFIKFEESGKNAAGSLNDLQQKVKTLRDQLSALSPDTQKFADTAKQLNVQLAALAAVEQKAALGAQELSASSKGFGLTLGTLIPGLTAANIATRLLYDGFDLIKRGFTDPIAQAAKFQQTMANVSSLIKGDPTQAVKTFNAAVLDLSKSIPKDPNDLGAGLYQVISAGFTNTADAIQILNVSAKAAVGGLTDTKTSVDAITTALNAYGLGASHAKEVSDSLFVAVRDGKLTYGELASSLGLVISTAAQARVPLDQMNAALVSLTLAGQQSSHAATDLNMFLDSVIKASKGSNAAAKEAKSLGIEYDTTALHAMGLAKFIQQIADKAGGNEVALQALTGDVRGFRAVAVLAGSGASSFTSALDDMANKAGTSDTAFQRNADTLENNWTLALNNLNAILIDAGQQQLPGMQKAVEDMTTAVNDNKAAIMDAANALSVSLVGGMKEVVKDAPAIINALSAIGKVAAVVASGIVDVIKVASSLGGGITDIALNGMALVGNKDAQAALALQDLGPKMFDQQRALEFKKDGRDYSPTDMMSRAPARQYQSSVNESPASTTQNKQDTTQGVPPSGGGQKESNKALEEAKKVLEDIKKIQEDITKSQDEQIKQNKAREDALRDELTLKKEMGVITTSEQTTLDRINARVDYQKDKVKEATQAWKDQEKVVDDLQKKVVDINKQITDEYDALQKTLKDIDKQTAKSSTDEIMTMMARQKQLQDQLANHQGLSPAEQTELDKLNSDLANAQQGAPGAATASNLEDLRSQKAGVLGNAGSKITPATQKKLDQLDAQIAAAQSTQDPYTEAAKVAKMSPLEKIKYDGEQQKKQAAGDANVKTATLTDQLAQTNTDLGDAQDNLKKKIRAVADAQSAQQVTLTSSYTVIEKATVAHVKAQVAQLDIEKQHVDALAASYASVQAYLNDPLNLNGGKPAAIPGHADGGMITGPGTGTSDSILARLSNGEYVMPAAATSAYRPILDAMRSMQFNLPSFATGGPVSMDNSRVYNIHQNYNGEAARIMSRPDLLRWHLRMAAA